MNLIIDQGIPFDYSGTRNVKRISLKNRGSVVKSEDEFSQRFYFLTVTGLIRAGAV